MRMLGDACNEGAQRLNCRSTWLYCIGSGTVGERWGRVSRVGSEQRVCGLVQQGVRGDRGA